MEAKVFIPKCAKSLAKFVAKDTIRPVMNYVLLDAVRGFIAASDCHVLRKIDISAEGDTEGMGNVLIDPKHISKVAGKAVNVHVDECNGVQRVTLSCDGTDYVTEYREMQYPNVLRVIPARDEYNAITLSKEAMDALKYFCKLNSNFNAMFFRVDGTKMYVYCKDECFGRLSSVCLDLNDNTGVEGTFAVNPDNLVKCLDGSNGIMSVRDFSRPFLFGGAADVTMIMPMCPNGADVSCEHHTQSCSTFAEDMQGIVSQLSELAMDAWNSILSTHEKLVPGTYDAKELTKKEPECGMIYYHDSDIITVECGCIKVQCTRGYIFAILAQYEKVAKCDKTQFIVPGEVAKKEKVSVLLNEDGEVLEKTLTITEITENVYTYKYKQKGYGERAKVIFKISGVYFEASDTNVFNVEKENFVSRSKQIYDNARITMQKFAEEGSVFFREVVKRIGEALEAETANVSAEGENTAERTENTPERKITYFHYTPEQLKRYIIDVYEKYANGEWVLDHQEDSDNGYYDVIDGKVIYWHDKRANRFSYYNMDFNSPTCGRCFRINRTYQKEKYVVSNEILMEFFMGDFYRNIHKQTVYNNGKYEHYYTIHDRHGNFNVGDFAYTFDGIMQRFNDCYKEHATIIWQSSEIPQRTESGNTMQPVAHGHRKTPTAQHTTTTSKHRHRANLAAKMVYSKTNIYSGVSPLRKNIYLCAKTLWEKQRLRSRERIRVAGKRKYTCPLQE